MKRSSAKKTTLQRAFRKYSQLLILSSLALILLLGTVVSFRLSQQTQDIRQEASTPTGLVRVRVEPQGALQVGQPNYLNFMINTNQIQVDGVQLEFTLNTDTADRFDLVPVAGNPLQLLSKKIVHQGGSEHAGQLIGIANIGEPFSSTQDTIFAQLIFTPTTAGTLSLTFDQVNSLSTVFDSDPVRDELGVVESVSFQIASPTSTPVPTATIAQITNRQCNEQCDTNAQCAVNLMCASGRCRLATNPTSTSCSAPTTQLATCNQTCTNNASCTAGLTCYNTRCRNPQHPQSSTCSAPTNTPTKTPTPRPTTSAGIGGSVATTTPTKSSTPTPQPTVTSIVGSQYLEEIEDDTVNNVFGTDPILETNSPTPAIIAQGNTSSSPTPTQTMSIEEFEALSNAQSKNAISKQTLFLLIALAFITIPILYYGPKLLPMLTSPKPKHPHIGHSLQEHDVKPSTDELKFFGGNRDAIDEKPQSKK